MTLIVTPFPLEWRFPFIFYVFHSDGFPQRTDIAGFAAWYSCPVCAYRICSGCASSDVPDFANKDKSSVENMLIRQFANFGKNTKNNTETHSGESPLPGQAQ